MKTNGTKQAFPNSADTYYMKKIFLSLAFACFSLPLFAINWEDFSLSVEPFLGLKSGQVDEYVFLKNSNFSDDKLSELNWEIKPEWYYGLKAHGEWKNFFEETQISFGIPMNTGLMMDSDWRNIQYSASSGGNTAQTNYSESDNHLDYDISFSLKGGYEFTVKEIFKIKPAAAFEYHNIKFTGKGGTAWYGNTINTGECHDYGPWYNYNDSNHRTILGFSGKDVISYQRSIDFLWLGSDFSVILPKNFEVSTGFFFAPFVYAISYDSHLLTKIDYADKTIGFFGAFKWNLGATYNITEKHAVSLSASYFYMRVLRGDDYEKASSASSYKKSSSAEGGAGAKYFDLTLSYRFKIF